MPGLSLQGTVTTEAELTKVQQTALQKDLRAYQKTCQQIADLEAAKTELKAKIDALREEAGLENFEFQGFTVTLVAASRSVLDKQKLIALGCKAEWLKKATADVPSKPYILITPPKVA